MPQSKPTYIFTPEEAASWLGMSVEMLERSSFRRARLGRGIVRYLSTALEEDIAAGSQLRPPLLTVEEPPAKERAQKRNSSWVYVVRAIPSGNLKIGRAVDVEKRMKSLQTGTWEGLDVILTIADDRNLERELHTRFAADRMGGEWFRPNPEIMAWLAKNGARL